MSAVNAALVNAAGEIAVTLAGKRWRLRPTFRAIADIETRLGQGIVPLAGRLAARQFGVVDVAVILDACIVEVGKPTYEEIGAAVLRDGVTALNGPLNDLMLGVLRGLDPQPERAREKPLPGEAGAPAAEPTGSPTGA